MKPLRLAVIGLGKLGEACGRAIMADQQLVLAGIVRRIEHVAEPLPDVFRMIPAVSHVSELSAVDGAIICVPTEHVLQVAHDHLQHGVAIVECAELHGEAFLQHKHAIDRSAVRHKTAALVGAGWDPGALSLFRNLFALLTPKGHTEITHRPGVSLHHSTVAGAVPGVKQALSTERHTIAGKTQRYVYVELESGVDPIKIDRAIRSDPHFLGEEMLVFPVESVAALEDEGHGVFMERRGAAAGCGHQLFLLEARFSKLALTAEVMLAAARALPGCKARAYGLFDLPLGRLWGELRDRAEKEWI